MFRRLLLAALLPCLLPVASRAETAGFPVIRHASVGFSHQFPNRRWTPLRVDIENPGPQRRATIVVEPASRAQGQSIGLRKPVWLPAQSRTTHYLAVFPDASEIPPPTKPGHEAAQTPAVVKVFDAKLTDGALQVWSQYDVMGKLIPDNAALMLVSDARLTSYRIPTELLTGWTRKPLHRVGLDPRDLPARAVDYSAIELLVLGDLGTRTLHTMQVQAICDWVRAGGTLLVPASTNLPAFLLPLLPGVFATTDQLATEPRLQRWGTPPVFADGILLRRLDLRDGNILAGDVHSPLLAQRAEGLGRIVVFPLDAGNLEFQRWPGATNLNAELLTRALKGVPAADRLLEHAAATDGIVSSLAGIKVLGRVPILAYLAILVAGMIAVLYSFRFTRAPERGWTVVAVLAVVTGGIVIVVADRWKGQPQPFLNEVNIVAVSADAQQAVAHSALGLYSPRAGTYDLHASAETLRLRPRRSPDPFSVQVDADLRLAGLAVRASDMRAMFGQAILPAGQQPHARARLTETGLELTVQNPTGQMLEDCFFKSSRFVAPLGDLPAGATKTFRNLETGDAFSTRVVQSASDELRTRIRRLFFPDPVYTLARQRLFDTPTFRERGPALYGWTDQPLFPATVEQRIARRAVNLWNIEAPVTYEGRHLTIPRGLAPLRLKNRDARTIERAEGRYSGTRGSTILAEFSLPAECPDLQITSARVFVNYRGDAFRCRVEMVKPGTEEFTARAPAGLTGGPVYTVPNPGQWYDNARRSFLVAVDIEPVSLDQSTAVNYWQIRELDMEIGGSVP